MPLIRYIHKDKENRNFKICVKKNMLCGPTSFKIQMEMNNQERITIEEIKGYRI